MDTIEIINLRQLFNSPESIKLAKVIVEGLELDDDIFNEVILGGKWERSNDTKIIHDYSHLRQCGGYKLKIFTYKPGYKSVKITYNSPWHKTKRFEYDLNINHEIQAKRLRKYLNDISWFN